METPNLFKESPYGRQGYCPLCNSYWSVSEYLAATFKKDTTLWLANMVTHYRHNHVKWDKQWSSSYFQSYCDYDKEKEKVNNRAKRQIMRKAATFLRFHNVNFEDLTALQSNDDKTLELGQKLLSHNLEISSPAPTLGRYKQKTLF